MASKTSVQVPIKIRAVGFKVTPEQYREMADRAQRSGARLGSWMRSVVLQAVAQKPRKGHLRIREPDGAT